MKKAALYARMSTRNGHQDPEVQLHALREVAERAGWEVAGEYVDHGVSGAKARDARPEFDRLCPDATRRKIDVAAAWGVDRLERSLQHLVAFLGALSARVFTWGPGGGSQKDRRSGAAPLIRWPPFTQSGHRIPASSP